MGQEKINREARVVR